MFKAKRIVNLHPYIVSDPTPNVCACCSCSQLRAKESVRPTAIECLRAVSRRTSDPGVQGELASLLRKLLDGSAEGKIKVGLLGGELATY
jgi:hypothetical protein